MPGPKGVITVEGSFEKAYYCEQDCISQAAPLVTPYALDGPSRNAKRAPAEETAKAAVALDQLSIGEAAKTPGGSGARLAPPSRRSAPRRGGPNRGEF
jgi:hypothetical protein